MDIKTIKKAETLRSLTMTLILVIGIFTGMFLYWKDNMENIGVTIETKYNSTYGNLTSSQNTLNKNVNDIKNNLDTIKEADNAFQVALNGFKGLGNTLKLPVSFVSTALGIFTGLTFSLDYIPSWVITLFFIGTTALIVFLVLSILKGDPRL